MKLRKGSHNATGLKFGVVVAKFNKFVTSKLLTSCVDGLTKHGVTPDDIEVVRVPGAFEIPNVQPGTYDLFVRMEHENGSPGPGGGIQAWGRATVEVRDQDVDGISVTIHPSVDVPGVVKIDGKLATAGGALRVGLSPTGTAGRLGNYRGILDRIQTPDANGKVTIPRAAEGNYQFFIQGADDLYIADVRQGDASILAGGIDVRPVSAGLLDAQGEPEDARVDLGLLAGSVRALRRGLRRGLGAHQATR